MSFHLLVVLFLSIVSHCAQAIKFPAEWGPACKNDAKLNVCLKESLIRAVPSIVPGLPKLGVFPLDPLHFTALSMHQGDGPVSIELDFNDIDIHGIKDIQIIDVKSDWKNMEVDVFLPNITLDGGYTVKGKILVLPISGSGPARITFENFNGTGLLEISKQKIGDKTYYNIDSFAFTFDSSHLVIRLENLFNGDDTLGQTMNTFLNDNWREILHELKPSISLSFGAAAKEIGNRIFHKIPADFITPP